MAVQAQLYPESLGLPMFGLQDWVLNNPVSGLEDDICFTFQEPHQQQNLFLQQQNSQKFGFDCNQGASSSSSITCDNFLSMSLSQSLEAHLKMQGQEIDCILQFQNERLRSALQEQRKQQLALLLKSVESKALSLMRQKQEELAQATKKNMELEACLRKAQMESDLWQRLAKENQLMVMELSNTLEQVRERLVLVSSRGQDAESSCCGSCDRELEESQKKIACKSCNSRSSCVLFLPCRHLCSCKSCEALLGSCPVCKSVKEESMEVFWF